jgi:hypothetical protein
MVSADHGVSPVPESLPDGPERGGRIYTAGLVSDLDAHLRARFGDGKWVESCIGPFLHLSLPAKTRPEVLDAARAWLEQLPGLQAVFGIEALRRASDPEPLAQRVAKSLGPDVQADLYLVQEPHFLLDGGAPPGIGSHHGSPHPYDTDVPILVWGPGVPVARWTEPVSSLRFAATLASLASVPSPPDAEQPPLL